MLEDSCKQETASKDENGRVAMDGTDSRQGEIELPTGRSLAGLRARATRVVKANPDMQQMLLSFMDDASLLTFRDADGNVAPQQLWDFRYQGMAESVWEDWKTPTQHAQHENVMITSRWKWVEKRDWHRLHSERLQATGGATAAAIEIPNIRIYYALAYEGSLS